MSIADIRYFWLDLRDKSLKYVVNQEAFDYLGHARLFEHPHFSILALKN
jgi:hypothetical protein